MFLPGNDNRTRREIYSLRDFQVIEERDHMRFLISECAAVVAEEFFALSFQVFCKVICIFNFLPNYLFLYVTMNKIAILCSLT